MQDSGVNENDGQAGSARRSRTVSNLSQEQIQHKRNVDRKAQRALRLRTKSRIQDLENTIATIKAASLERENLMSEQLQILREQNRLLTERLERISKFATCDESLENGTESDANSHWSEEGVEESEPVIGM